MGVICDKLLEVYCILLRLYVLHSESQGLIKIVANFISLKNHRLAGFFVCFCICEMLYRICNTIVM